MLEGHDGSGVGLFLTDLGGDLEHFKGKPVLSGIFSNGEIKALARLALAMFNSPWGLEKKGDNLWAETITSGNVSVGLPGTAGRGTLASNSLEQSNVDIATEFVKLIAAQRAFQANAKMITTSDELLNEVVNLKR